ncbi:MAG: LemA family protein [Chitinophagales bacterium]
MKRILKFVLVLMAMPMLSGCSYNTMISLDEQVKEAWANVEAAYQRRTDLIGNLVETVKGSGKFEKETLTEVINARSKATSMQVNANDLTPENIAKFQEAQSQLSGALSRLLVTVEKYPDLKTTAQYAELMNELNRTENRINVARVDFNNAVKTYNTTIRSFPDNLVAMIFGFKAKDMFKAEAGAEKAPKVSF